jgi:hypothetical protein
MANKPLDPVQFTRESAERVARVVRAAELATPRASPLSFAPLQDFRGTKVVKVATFTGGWAIGETKQVTLKYNTSVTAMAANLFYPLGTSASARDCLVAKSDGTWFLASVPLATATAVFARATSTACVFSSTTSVPVITPPLTVSVSFDPEACSVSSSVAHGTATIVSVVGTHTAVMVSMTHTATYLSFGG